MGTIDNIFVLHNMINYLLNNDKRLYVAFVDFTKAFDYLVRDIIWYKMIKLGIRGKILDIIRSLYHNVRTRIKYQNTLSEDFSCILGARQGESLSPFIFSMYLNDIEEHFMLNGFKGVDISFLKMFLLLYADDIVIFAENENDLQNGLQLLEDYCQRWKLTVNTKKTKIMVFRKQGRLRKNVAFYYNQERLEIVDSFSYLGIVFTTGGSFNMTFETLSGQGLKAMYKLNRELIRFPGLTIQEKLELFDKLVYPVLNYGSEIWGLNESLKIERIHLKFCKNLLGVKSQTQNNFINGELGRTNSWAKSVRSFLQSLGFNDVWL